MASEKVPKVGVVTVTYNSAQVLPDFFQSLWQQTHANFVLYAIDNASKDATRERLAAETDSRLIVVASESNVGVAEGNNIGVRRALQEGCDAVLLLNNDVVFERELISKLLAGLETHSCEMVAPKITYFQPSNLLWWAGGSFQKDIGWRTQHDGFKEIDRGQYDTPRLASYSPTCCVLLRSSVFDQVGFFDAAYFVYYDDTDFMYRAHQHGCKLYYLPTASLQHKVSSLTGGDSLFEVRYCTRNRVYFWLKHFGFARALIGSTILAAIFVCRTVARKASPNVFRTQLRALREGWGMANMIYRDTGSAFKRAA